VLFLSNSLQFIVKSSTMKSRKRFTEMTVDSPAVRISYNHFGNIEPRLRVLTIGVESRADGNILQFVKTDEQSIAVYSARDGDCWLVDIGNSDANTLDHIQRSGLPVVVAANGGHADSVLVDAADGYVLPGDDDAIIAAVLTRAVAGPPGLRVADLSDGAARTMQALSVEAGRIAERLAMLAATAAATPSPVRSVDAVLVRRIIKLRRDRERFLPAEILADPAWDILLDLTAARLEGKAVPVSSLCIAAAVPTTTALRWIRSLTEAGLLQRRLDTSDARRSHVALTDTAADAMLAWLRAFSEAFAPR
jgi:hypothetical protein